MPGVLRRMFDALGPWPGVRNVLNHGDVWANNFLFRHDDAGCPVEVALIDFQMVSTLDASCDVERNWRNLRPCAMSYVGYRDNIDVFCSEALSWRQSETT